MVVDISGCFWLAAKRCATFDFAAAGATTTTGRARVVTQWDQATDTSRPAQLTANICISPKGRQCVSLLLLVVLGAAK